MSVFTPDVAARSASEIPLCKLCSKPICEGGKVRVLHVDLSDPERIALLPLHYAGEQAFSLEVFEHKELVIDLWVKGRHIDWLCVGCYEKKLADISAAMAYDWEALKWKDGTLTSIL